VNQSSSARVRRDAAARAMQGWHAHRLLANGTHGDNILKVIEFPLLGFTFCLLTVLVEKIFTFLQDKDSIPLSSRDKNLKGFGTLHDYSFNAICFMIFSC
jgi:hypothetical protein